MKRDINTINILVLAVLMFSCQREELVDIYSGMTYIDAGISQTDTRTSISGVDNGTYKVLWSEGDEIAVKPIGQRDVYTFRLFSGAGTPEGRFVGETSIEEGAWAIFPAASYADEGFGDWKDGRWTCDVKVPQKQTYVPDSFDKNAFLMAGETVDGRLLFKGIFSVLKMSITGNRQIDSIVFTPNKKKIVCDFSVYRDEEGEYRVYNVRAEGSSDSLVLDCHEGVMLDEENPTEFYMVIPPGIYSGGFELSVYTPEGCMVKKTTDDIEFKKSQLRSLLPFRFGLAGDPCMPADTLIVNDDRMIVPCVKGVVEVNVQKSVGECRMHSTVDWIHHVQAKSVESETVLFEVEANPDDEPRKGIVWFLLSESKIPLEIVQSQTEEPMLDISSIDKVEIESEGGWDRRTITTNRDHLQVATQDEWLEAVIEERLVGETAPYRCITTIRIEADENNTSADREGQIVVSLPDENLSHTIIVAQKPVDYGELIIEVPEAGTLPEIVDGEEIVMYSEIKIVGEMNEDDIRYFEKYALKVKCLDLSEVTFENNTLYGFNELKELREVHLPPTLVQIGAKADEKKDKGAAFHKCVSLEKVDWGVEPQLEIIGTGIHAWDNGLGLVTKFEGPFSYCSSLKSIEIPAKVKTLLPGAFYNSGISEVVFAENSVIDCFSPMSYVSGSWLGNNMKSDTGVFCGCDYLETIEFPKSLTMIESGAFQNWTGLKTLNIPETVKFIETEKLFYGCSSLEMVSLPTSVTSIGGSMFNGCTNLRSVDMRGECVSVGGSAFEGCRSLESFDLENIEELGSHAFSGTGIRTVKFPDGMVEVPTNVFAGCSQLVNIDFNDVEIVGMRSFAGCTALDVLALPSSITLIQDWAFAGCDNLKSLYINCENVHFNRYSLEIENIEEIIIGNKVRSVTTGYNGMGLPESFDGFVFEEGCILEEFGLCAGLTGLTSITLPQSVNRLASYAFYGCSCLEDIDDILSGISEIGSQAFAYTGIRNVDVPACVERIEDRAFKSCPELRTITLPSSLEYLGTDAFDSCSKLTSAIINGSDLVIGSSVFRNCKFMEKIVFSADLKSLTYDGKTTASILSNNIKEVEFESDSQFKTISGYIFANKSNLTKIVLPESLVEIGDNVFNCSTVSEIILPDNLKKIGSGSFSGSSISVVDIPESVTEIGDYAFRSSNIEEVYVRASVPPQLKGNDNFYSSSLIYVPVESVEDYMNNAQWKKYTIVGHVF